MADGAAASGHACGRRIGEVTGGRPARAGLAAPTGGGAGHPLEPDGVRAAHRGCRGAGCRRAGRVAGGDRRRCCGCCRWPRSPWSPATAVDRITRRLLPVAALYQLSLVFPDQAPSRFGHAVSGVDPSPGAWLGGGAGSDTGTVQSEAERLLALVHQRPPTIVGHRATPSGQPGLRPADRRGDRARPRRREKLNWGALLHDIGKLDVPCALLNKPGEICPTADEWAVLRRHPEHAAHYIEPLRPWLGDWLDAATQHHERIDGRGYPHGRRRPDRPLAPGSWPSPTPTTRSQLPRPGPTRPRTLCRPAPS